ncbi:hypothetical protein CRENBAI_001475 [Crenichthys baileyi]|uniref:Uncharacterized protein n=1 Tax=Crenichthys baileyi TaxID=28760 RepID=A0AAV9SRF2_9TELE
MSFINNWRRSVRKDDSNKSAKQAQDIPDSQDSLSRLSVLSGPELDPIITDFKLQLPGNSDAQGSMNPSSNG